MFFNLFSIEPRLNWSATQGDVRKMVFQNYLSIPQWFSSTNRNTGLSLKGSRAAHTTLTWLINILWCWWQISNFIALLCSLYGRPWEYHTTCETLIPLSIIKQSPDSCCSWQAMLSQPWLCWSQSNQQQLLHKHQHATCVCTYQQRFTT